MPTIVRWFRVTHDINADPEMWELRDTFGDRAGFVWLECLSIADRNSGVVGPVSDQTRNQLASKSRTSRVKVGLVLDWCRVKGWLACDSHWRVAKWRKYNKTRDAEQIPSETTPRLLLSETLKITTTPASPEPAAGVKKPNGLDPEIKKFADQIYATDPEKYRKLIVWLREAEKYHFAAPVVAETLRRFLPYRASKAECWWAYLNDLIKKVGADMNRDAATVEHEAHKAAERKFAIGALRGIVKDA